LLKLPEDVRQDVAAGRLSMGHARALVTLTDAGVIRKLAGDTIARGYSVRQVERLARKYAAGVQPPSQRRSDVHTRAAEEQMRLALGTQVRIIRKGKGGNVRIDFKSEDDLQRIYERITGS
jgi:ParB family chromosome partitioning protein